MMETLGGGLTTDMAKNHHTFPPTSNSSSGGWNGGGGGESRPDHHLSGLPVDRNVDGNTHLSITVSETISHHCSSSDVGSIGHSGSAVTNGGESGSSVAHNVNLTSITSGGNAVGNAGTSSLPSSGDSMAENVKAETAFNGFVSGLETNCNEQGQGGIGNVIDSGHPTYKRTNSAPPISDYMFSWPQSELNSGSTSISDNAVGGMAGSKTGNDSSEVGCTTSESINTDYYSYDYGGPQSIPHYSSGHGHSHSAMTAQQLETSREMARREIGHTARVSYSSEPPLGALGGVATGGGTGSVFATDPRGSPHVGLENLYRGGDQDMQRGGDELAPPIFADGHSRRHHPAERHMRASNLIPGVVLEYPLTYPPGNSPSPPGPQNFLTDIICPGDFPSDGREREAYVVSQGTVTKCIDSQGFPMPIKRQQSPPNSFGSHRDRALPHSNSQGILECIADDDSTGRPRYPSTSHKALNSEVYDETLVARSDSYGGPGSASGRGGGGAQQGQQEVMDLNSAFAGLAVSKPSKSHGSIQKQRSYSSLPTAHQQSDYEAASVGFKTSPYIDYNPSEYRADLRNHSQSGGRLDVEALMSGQADLKTAEPQVVQPANAYYVDPRGPGMYALDPHFQYRPVANQQYAEPPLYAQDVDHRRAMAHPPPDHLAYYPTDPRSTMSTLSAPPRDPVYHRRAYSPSDDLGYEGRHGGGGARQKPFKERRDRDKETRDRTRDKPRVGCPVIGTGITGRPSLLEAFLSNGNGKGRRWELSDIQGQVVQFCRDQHGSRFIQQKLEISTVEEKELFFEEILPHVPNLITDVFGNYVIQKLFDHGTLSQQEGLAGFLAGHAVHLSLQMYGCRVVQKALMFASLDTLISLVKEFRGHVMRCVQDQNGNHVIQKCIEVVSRAAEEQGAHLHKHIQFIIDAFANQVQKLSTHAYGCRVIQRIFEYCVDSQRDAILAEIRISFSGLIGDQYGNYVIQHVIKHGKPKDRNVLMEEVHKNLLAYSQHKFASNVVEKCLQFGTLKERAYIIDHVFTENAPGMRDGQKNILQTMVCDPYANYVVQKMLDVATPEQHCAIIAEIKAHSTQLKRFTFGKYIISRLEKLPGNEEA